MYNGKSNLSTQRCRLIFWVERSVGCYLVLAKTIPTNFIAGIRCHFHMTFVYLIFYLLRYNHLLCTYLHIFELRTLLLQKKNSIYG
jgi:hypothetical protein